MCFLIKSVCPFKLEAEQKRIFLTKQSYCISERVYSPFTFSGFLGLQSSVRFIPKQMQLQLYWIKENQKLTRRLKRPIKEQPAITEIIQGTQRLEDQSLHGCKYDRGLAGFPAERQWNHCVWAFSAQGLNSDWDSLNQVRWWAQPRGAFIMLRAHDELYSPKGPQTDLPVLIMTAVMSKGSPQMPI